MTLDDAKAARGYVKVYRCLLDSGVFRNPKLAHFWLYCLLKASHRRRTAMVGYEKVGLEPGQFVFGRRKAAAETGLSERAIRTCIRWLKSGRKLTIKATRRYSVITICNWESYQGSGAASDPSSDQLTTHQRPQTRMVKNVEKEEETTTSHEAPDSTRGNGVPYETILAAYNEACPSRGLPRAIGVSDARERHLKARWAEPTFRERFREIFARAAASDYCCGLTGNKWKVDFGWLIENDDHYVKVLEGRYDNRSPNPGDGPSGIEEDPPRNLTDEHRRALGWPVQGEVA